MAINDALLETLRNGGPEERCRALEVVAGLPLTAAVIDALVEAAVSNASYEVPAPDLGRPDPPAWGGVLATQIIRVAEKAIDAIRALGPPAIDAYLARARADTPLATRLLASAGQLGPASVALLREALSSPDPARVTASLSGLADLTEHLTASDALAVFRAVIDQPSGETRDRILKDLTQSWRARPARDLIRQRWEEDLGDWVRARIDKPFEGAEYLAGLLAALAPEEGRPYLAALLHALDDRGRFRALVAALLVDFRTVRAVVEGDPELHAWIEPKALNVAGGGWFYPIPRPEQPVDYALISAFGSSPDVFKTMMENIELGNHKVWGAEAAALAEHALAVPERFPRIALALLDLQLAARPGVPRPGAALAIVAAALPEAMVDALIQSWSRIEVSSNAFRFAELAGRLGPPAAALLPYLERLRAQPDPHGRTAEALNVAVAAIRPDTGH